MAKLAPGELVPAKTPTPDELLRKAYQGDPPAERRPVSNRDLLRKAGL